MKSRISHRSSLFIFPGLFAKFPVDLFSIFQPLPPTQSRRPVFKWLLQRALIICTLAVWIAVWLLGQFFPVMLDKLGIANTS